MGRSLRFKLVGVVAIVLGIMALVTAVAFVAAGAARNDVASVNGTYVPATRAIGDLHLGVAEYNRDQFAYLAATDETARSAALAAITKHTSEVNDAFDGLTNVALGSDLRVRLSTAKADWDGYVDETANLNTAGRTAELAALQSGQPASDFDALDTELDDLYNAVAASANVAGSDANSLTGFLSVLLPVGCVLALIAGGGMAWFLSGRVVRGIQLVKSTLTSMSDKCMTSLECGLAAMAENDLTMQVESTTPPIDNCGSDEVGQMAAATNMMLVRLRATMASYEQARANLAGALGEVHIAAQSVSSASVEVNDAAQQSGQGSAQIAQTIGQVASGASDQAQAAGATASAINDLQTVIESVRSGAAETARSVEAQASAVHQMTRSIRSASYASSDVQSLGAAAGAAATNGAETVRQTVAGMARIKDAVEGAAVKVTELGAKGGQIGAIVETIDDIAEQTNLLALNAAIEAARAGEQGKGFAVVADEVRKLAERSSRATKEIAALIGDVQAGTEAAVQAMQAGAGEVATGAELAEQAAGALQEIRDAAAARNVVLEDMLAAVVEIRALSSDVVRATDSIAEIASETNAAAAQMGSASDTVAQSVDSIAAVSEENSAAAEEVSAATEQLSAQSEMVVAHAATLAEMAQGLDELVARFRLEQGQPTIAANIIPRRRASDWQAPGTRLTESA
jgi:methyl-accepting chemotaxis protein